MTNSKLSSLLLLIVMSFQILSLSQVQSNQTDTTISYLKKTAIKLLKPHSNMTFSFGTEELKNKIPDLHVETPNLKDTIKYLEELKGEYVDWRVFYKIGKLYQHFEMEKNAFDYYTSAYNLITAEIKKDSLNSAYFSDMGNLYLDIKNNQYAFAYYKMAYELNPNDTSALNILPMFYIFSGDSESAKNIIDKNLKNNPKHINSYIWYITMIVMDEFKVDHKAEEILNKNIEEIFNLEMVKSVSENYKNDPRFPVLYNLSKLLAMFGKYAMVLDDFKELELIKNDKSELKKLQKFFKKAIIDNQFKNKYILYKALGFIYIFQKNKDKAIENFQLAMKYWPKDKLSQDYYILFSIHYFLNDDTLKAIEVINKKIDLDKELYLLNPDDYVLKGNVFLNMQNKVEAQKAYESAIKLSLKTKDAYLGLAVLELQENKLLESNNFINKAYELDKEYYLSYALFGIITLMADDKEKAKDALSKAMELKPDDKDIKKIFEAFFN
ncbi:MAG: hypothetical protein DRJ07_02310 [Bacteroidetes bacterium]|nr:MAG: hypothetical protein DRJ07_02310 [Bacteroidota bacterium]